MKACCGGTSIPIRSPPGQTLTGAPALGHRTLKELGKRPSLTQAWIAGMKLSASSKGQVISVVSSVFIAAMDDRLISRNPTRAQQRAGITPPLAKGEKRKAARDQGMHVLRHTAASAWLSAGADIVAVAAWLGDTVETVYKTYAHLMPDADDRGRKAIDQFFRRPGREGSALDVPSDGAK